MVIAIDGPSGVGKSTVSRGVAAALGMAYLDTGSYYRAVTHVALTAGVDPADEQGILDAARDAPFAVVDGALSLDGSDISAAIRSPEVTAAVSAVAAHPRVRETVVQMQRDWATQHDGRAVIEGRDIGTVVFPDAPPQDLPHRRPVRQGTAPCRRPGSGGSVRRCAGRRDAEA